MLLFNENHKQLNVSHIKEELRNTADTVVLSTEEMETELGDYYNQALKLEGDKYQFSIKFNAAALSNDFFDPGTFFPKIGNDILKAIKKFVCQKVNGSSTSDEIIDAVLDAVSSIIPGGIFLKPLVKKLVKYILSIGVDAFCSSETQ